MIRIAEDLQREGAIRIEESVWLARRTANSIEREAWRALAAARTERTANILLNQWHGALRVAIEEILTDCRLQDFTQAKRHLQALVDRATLGRHLVTPFDVVLAGPPNVGKSSLINALVGYDRSIVYDAPGTTRDVITADTAIDGWPVTLSDTAGLRDSDDPLEAAGVQSARERLRGGDLVVLLFDASMPIPEQGGRLLSEFSSALTVLTKCDLLLAAARPRSATDGMLRTNAVTGAGIAELLAAISGRLVPAPPPSGAAVPFTAEQAQTLQEALAALAHADSKLAIEMLSALLAPPA